MKIRHLSRMEKQTLLRGERTNVQMKKKMEEENRIRATGHNLSRQTMRSEAEASEEQVDNRRRRRARGASSRRCVCFLGWID